MPWIRYAPAVAAVWGKVASNVNANLRDVRTVGDLIPQELKKKTSLNNVGLANCPTLVDWLEVRFSYWNTAIHKKGLSNKVTQVIFLMEFIN